MVELTFTVKVPDDLAQKLQRIPERLPEILELGLRELTPLESRVFGEALEFLGKGVRPEDIVAFRPSYSQQTRVRELLDRNQAGALSDVERSELDLHEQLEHLMILLKAKARRHLVANPGA